VTETPKEKRSGKENLRFSRCKIYLLIEYDVRCDLSWHAKNNAPNSISAGAMPRTSA